MGRSHSKVHAPPPPTQTNSTVHKRSKFRMNIEKKKLKKFWFGKKKSKMDQLKVPLPTVTSEINYQNGDFEVEIKRRMQEQLAFNSDIFVLDQMMMSVQFFANYERDLWEAVELNRNRENQKTEQVTKHCKTILMPDRLYEAVDRRVKYVAKHGKFKNQLQPLQTQTIYIVHDNIEITNPGENSVYSILSDAPIYKLQIDDPFEGSRKKKVVRHVGYIKLKSFERITKNDVLSYNLSSDSQYVSGSLKNEDDDETDIDEDEIDVPEGFLRAKLRDSIRYGRNKVEYYTPSSVSISPASSEYDYTYIRALHTHQPLNMLRQSALIKNPLSTVMLPDTCISNVSRFMINNKKQEQFYSTGYSTDDESEEKEINESQYECYEGSRESYYYEDKQYLNSKEFLSYFINLFQQTLASDLGISEETMKNATWKGSAVYCEPWEIIPAISCPWPREANEWIFRQRESRVDPLTGQFVQWPSIEMINKITNFGCHVIPQGYAPKLGTNLQRELEWKIVFPEAERYLESRLTSSQAKVYMMTKILLKTFIEPNLERGVNMFTTEHIRAHLFWQCEYNYTAWYQEHLGEALIKFLTSLLHCIKTHRLPDYFLPKRNLFQNIPEKILVDLHKRIFRIVESPVPYVMIAIRNLRYQRNFYPKLKCKRLYSRLIIDDPNKIYNPKVDALDVDALVHAPSDDEEKEAPLGSIAYFDRKERRSRKRRTRCVRFALDEHYVAAYTKRKEAEKDLRRSSIESIDTKIKILKHMEMLRRKLVFELFIEQFIEMSHVSIKYRSLQQTMELLKQAERLCLLLRDDKFVEEAEDYQSAIESLRLAAENSISATIQGPELPRRESLLDKKAIKIRFRPEEPIENSIMESKTNLTEVPSDDDNDEIYNYHKSIVVQIHATSAENLARFNHNDGEYDDIDEIASSMEKLDTHLDNNGRNMKHKSDSSANLYEIL
ncbi:CLUMA_CG009990, isoform A [Clunio marinus]|uniref:CLUMA_CG009990, isoform A n=1 Tax=Clunio marinus TaxID=568069 RepID=A0A1J1I8L1_9DIPT|nr:CLUMA_CG009990, isoform A [Clunio marinus]